MASKLTPFPPAKIPKQIKIDLNKFSNPWIGKNKAKDMADSIKSRVKDAKQRKAKSLKWKKLSDWRYEVYASETLIGEIEVDVFNNWKIYPEFEYEENFFSRIKMGEKYNSFREAGHGLAEFWCAL